MNKRILIIDDTRAIHEDFRKILVSSSEKASLDALEAELFGTDPAPQTEIGYELESAYRGEDAHEMVARSVREDAPYAMAFVDMRMPAGWDGLVTIQHLWKVDPELQVVICTAYSDHSWEDLFRQLGPSDNLLVLKKPFDDIEVCQLAYTLTTKRHLGEQATLRTREIEDLVEQRTQELMDTSLRLQSILDAVPVGLVTLRADGFIEGANRSAGEAFGYLPDEMEGVHLLELLQAPEAGQDWQELVDHHSEVEGRRKDGTSFPVQVSVRDVPLHSGPVYTGVLSDITERKKVLDDLLQAKSRAEAADQAKTEFLARMSHEIRTPMTGVLGMAHALLGGDLKAEQKSCVELIVVSGESLLTLINEVLDLAKVESGQMVLESAPFDLRRLVREVVSLMAPVAAGRGLELRWSYDGPDWFSGDLVRVRQVLSNLLNNALKFTEEGGVNVRVSMLDQTVRMEVEDTGVGVAPAKQELIFERFTQADDSTTRRYGGTGLGLPICRQLVELMGGRIGLDSRLGQGSNFWVNLPLKTTAPPEAPSETPNSVDLSGLRILLAEDTVVSQKVAMNFLNRFGCKVDLAANGKEAVRLFREKRFDMVLMDCHMPILDGFSATRIIRKLKGGQEVPIIAFTASTVGDELEQCREAGMDFILTKPLTPNALREALSRWNLGRAVA